MFFLTASAFGTTVIAKKNVLQKTWQKAVKKIDFTGEYYLYLMTYRPLDLLGSDTSFEGSGPAFES